MPFPVGFPLQPSLYLQRFSKYSVPKTRAHAQKHTASDFAILCNILCNVLHWQTIGRLMQIVEYSKFSNRLPGRLFENLRYHASKE